MRRFAVCALLLAAGAARAQDLFPPEDLDFSNSAFVRLSDEARSALYTGDRLAADGDVPGALQAYQTILDRLPDALVELSDRTIASGFEAVHRRIAALGAAGRDRCEHLFGERAAAARAMALQRFDLAGLLDAADRYPFTRAAERALREAAVLAAEQGRPRQVQLVVERMLRRGQARPDDLARLGMALAQAGDAADLRSLRQRTEAQAAAVIAVGGRTRSLGDLLDELLREVLPPDLAEARSALAEGRVVARVLGRFPPDERALNPREDPDPRRANQIPGMPPIGGVVTSAHAWVVGQLGIYRLDRDAQPADVHPLLRFDADLGVSAFADVANRSLQPTVHHGLLYVPLDIEIYGQGPRQERGELLAVDLEEGKEVFRVYTTLPDLDESLRGFVFEGPARVHGDLLLVTGSRLHGATTLCSLFAFRRTTGDLAWALPLAEAARVDPYDYRNQPTEAQRALPAPVVIRDGVAYCVTNLGVVASVEAQSGRVRWLFKYNRFTGDDPENYRRIGLFDGGGWKRGEPVVVGGALVAAPEDSRYLYVLAQEPSAEGDLRLQDPLAKGHREALLAVEPETGTLVFSSREVVGPRLDDLRIVLERIGPAGIGRVPGPPPLEREEELAGQPLIVGRTLYLPTTKRVLLLDLEQDGNAFGALEVPDALLRLGERLFYGNLSLHGEVVLSVSPAYAVLLSPQAR